MVSGLETFVRVVKADPRRTANDGDLLFIPEGGCIECDRQVEPGEECALFLGEQGKVHEICSHCWPVVLWVDDNGCYQPGRLIQALREWIRGPGSNVDAQRWLWAIQSQWKHPDGGMMRREAVRRSPWRDADEARRAEKPQVAGRGA